MAKGEVRARMVGTAAQLLAEKGPSGASFGDVLKAAEASRGSTYHHFPDGKRELYIAALDLVSQRAFAAMDDVHGQPADVVVDRFFAMWRMLLTRTDLRAGCAVLAVAVSGDDPDVVAHAGAVFTAWREHLASLFVAADVPRARAAALATVVIAAAEGAVALARAEQDLDVFESVATQIRALVTA